MLIITLFNVVNSYFQYSNYYQVDVNSKSEVKEEIRINQTVTKIDYGAMALAEAQKEKNMLEYKIYNDNNKKIQAIQIAVDPSLSYELEHSDY